MGAAVFLAAVAAPVLGPRIAAVLAAACGGLAFCALVGTAFRKLRRAVRCLPLVAAVMVSLSVVLGLYTFYWHRDAVPAQAFDGLDAQVEMEILDYPEQRYGRCYYRARVLEVDGNVQETPFIIRLSCAEPLYCQPCDRVSCQVSFYSFREEGLYSARHRQLAAGNALGAYLKSYNVEYFSNPDPMPVGRLLPDARQMVSSRLARCLPGDEAGLLQTLLLGDSENFTAYSDFRQIGCAHMLAVSGLHMTLVAAFVTLALARVPGGRLLKNFLCVALLFAYLALTGFPTSAVRSYVMFFLFLLGKSIGAKPDSLNSLGLAVLVICLFNPFSGGDVGFSLSVLSTAGIILLHGPLRRAFTAPIHAYPILALLLRPLISSLSVTLSAMVFTLPVQIAVFGGLPLISPLANLLILPLFTALLYCALPLLLISIYSPAAALAQPFILACGLLARSVLWLAKSLASLPGIFLSFGQPEWAIAGGLGILGALILLAAKTEGIGKCRQVVVTVLFVLAVCTPVLWGIKTQGTVTVAVCGDDESACVLIMKDGDGAVLSMGGFDSGKAGQILLEKNVLNLESVLISGVDYRAKKMTRDLLAQHSPKHLYLLEGAYVGKDLKTPGTAVEYVPLKGSYQALPGIGVEISEDGGRLSFSANGTQVIVDLGSEDPGSCDLLITGGASPALRGGLVLLLCAEGTSPEEAARVARSDFVMASSQEVTYAEIDRDGGIKIIQQ